MQAGRSSGIINAPWTTINCLDKIYPCPGVILHPANFSSCSNDGSFILCRSYSFSVSLVFFCVIVYVHRLLTFFQTYLNEVKVLKQLTISFSTVNHTDCSVKKLFVALNVLGILNVNFDIILYRNPANYEHLKQHIWYGSTMQNYFNKI